MCQTCTNLVHGVVLWILVIHSGIVPCTGAQSLKKKQCMSGWLNRCVPRELFKLSMSATQLKLACLCRSYNTCNRDRQQGFKGHILFSVAGLSYDAYPNFDYLMAKAHGSMFQKDLINSLMHSLPEPLKNKLGIYHFPFCPPWRCPNPTILPQPTNYTAPIHRLYCPNPQTILPQPTNYTAPTPQYCPNPQTILPQPTDYTAPTHTLPQPTNYTVPTHKLYCPNPQTILSQPTDYTAPIHRLYCPNPHTAPTHKLYCPNPQTILPQPTNYTVPTHRLYCPNPQTILPQPTHCPNPQTILSQPTNYTAPTHKLYCPNPTILPQPTNYTAPTPQYCPNPQTILPQPTNYTAPTPQYCPNPQTILPQPTHCPNPQTILPQPTDYTAPTHRLYCPNPQTILPQPTDYTAPTHRLYCPNPQTILPQPTDYTAPTHRLYCPNPQTILPQRKCPNNEPLPLSKNLEFKFVHVFVLCNLFFKMKISFIWFHDFWLVPPEQRYWQNRETANIGLVSSVGWAPAHQSGGCRFKSRSSHPKLI